MEILKKEYMDQQELEYYQMLENFAESHLPAAMDPLTEEERTFARRMNEIINIYSWNMYEQNKLNERIYSIKDPEEWKTFFRDRAVRLGKLYEENEAVLREVKAGLERPLSFPLARFWVTMMAFHFNNRGITDIHCAVPVLNKVIPFLESQQHWNSMCQAYFYHSLFVFSTLSGLGSDSGSYENL